MAKPSSVASSAASGTRRTRATRSASAEPTVEPPSTSTAKKGKGRPPAGKKGRGRQPKNATELTTVNEDATIEDQLKNDMLAAEAITVDEMEDVRRASAAPSHVSAATAKTSFSQEEISELDREQMVDVLPNIAFTAEELSKLLVPADPKKRQVVRKEIRLADSKYNKSYLNRIKELEVHKSDFGSTEYIQPSIVLRALLGVKNMNEVPDGPWRPDSIIYKINLAQMLNCVLVLVPDITRITEEGKSAMENLNVHFASGIAGPRFSEGALNLQLALLVQLSIIYLAQSSSHPEFDAERIIMSVFYAPDQDGDLTFQYSNALHMMNLPEEESTALTDDIIKLVRELRDTFDSGVDITTGLARLRAQYPWDAFMEQVIQYYMQRKLELDQQIAAADGVDEIISLLTEEVQRWEDARVAEAKRETFARPTSTPKTAFTGKKSIRALQAREKRAAAEAAAPPTPAATLVAPPAQMIQPNLARQQPSQPIVVADDDGFNRMEDDDRPLQPTQAQTTAHAVLSNLKATQRQNAAKGKGRLFADRQEGAVRVNFDDDSQSQLTDYRVPSNFQYPSSTAREGGPYYQNPRRTAAKRTHDDEDEDQEEFEPTQDQGFQTDTRDIAAAADQRRRDAPQVHPRVVPQGRFSSAPAPRPSASAPSPKRQRKNPGSSIPPPPAPYDPDGAVGGVDDRMQRAKIAARHGTITARQVKPTQQRTPWSQEEENGLIDLIEMYGGDGIKYANLKALDEAREEPVLGRRGAEDMRFKARNMKETFLKGRSALPRNFKFIVLDKKAISKLHGLGIEYHQDRIRGGYVEIEMD